MNVVMKQFDLDEQIECAVREKGAKEHLASLERTLVQQQKRSFRFAAIAASFMIMLTVGLDVKLSGDIRTVGYAFNPVEGQSGGSEITALMQDKNIKEALVKIEEARVLIQEEKDNPVHEDQDYLTQLDTDGQELDFLEAVCYMRLGKYIKAKKVLKQIVALGGHFSGEAEKLLNQL